MSREGINSRSQLRSMPPTNKSQARGRDRITDTCIRNDSDWHVDKKRYFLEWISLSQIPVLAQRYETRRHRYWRCIHPWGSIVLWKTGSVTSPAGRVAELLCFRLAPRPWNAPNNSLDISNLMGWLLLNAKIQTTWSLLWRFVHLSVKRRREDSGMQGA